MKRLYAIIFLVPFFIGNTCAQEKFIDHLAIGLVYGTTSMSAKNAVDYVPFCRQTDGVEMQLDAELASWLDARIGISLTPSGGGSGPFCIEGVPDGKYITEKVQLQHTYGITAGCLFLDFYPFRNTAFHITAGAYAGTNKLLKINNIEPIPEELATYNTGVAEIHGLAIPTDMNGNINAKIKMPAVRPYLGIGINTSRLSEDRFYFGANLGVMYKGNNGMTILGPDGQDVEVDYWLSKHYVARMTAWNKKCAVAPLLSFSFFLRLF